MEERVPSAKEKGEYHNHSPPHSPRPPPSTPPPATSPPPDSPRRPPSFDESETYIVQVPRDLVYRVPPPENAKIVESYRNPSHSKNHQCGGRSRLRIFLSLAILALIAAIVVVFVHTFLSPKTPQFSITKVHMKSPPTSHHKKTHPTYLISLKADNPNPRMGVSHEDGGDISLSFKKKEIAQGKYPTLSLDSKDSTTVRVTLHGSKAALPSEIQKSMDDRKSKRHVSLSLSINAPVKLTGLIGMSKDMKVTCDFKVSTLASGTRVLSQDCDTKF